MSFNKIISDPQQVTAHWITESLRTSGKLQSDNEVVECFPTLVSGGFCSTLLRVSLKFKHKVDIEDSVMVKFALPQGEGLDTAKKIRMYSNEEGFFRIIGDDVSRTYAKINGSIPKCYYTALEAEPYSYTIVMEDLITRTPKLQPGNELIGLNDEQMKRSIVAIANFHSIYYGRNELFTSGKLSFIPSIIEHHISPRVELFDLYDSVLGNRLQSKMRELFVKWTKVHSRVLDSYMTADGPWTIAHGDFRADNIFFDENNEHFCIIDFQLLRYGNIDVAMQDISYLIGFGLDINRRKLLESNLIDLYHQTLIANGVNVSKEDLWRAYFKSYLYYIGFLFHAGIILLHHERGQTIFLEWVNRLLDVFSTHQIEKILDEFQ